MNFPIKSILTFLTVIVASSAIASPFPDAATQNRIFGWNAGWTDDRDGSSQLNASPLNWQATTGGGSGGTVAAEWDFGGDLQSVTDQHIDGVTTNWHIDGTYDWNGSVNSTTAGNFQETVAGTGITAGGANAINYTAENASFELWFRPNSETGQRVLFEAGDDSNGLSITTNGTTIELSIVNGTPADDIFLTLDYAGAGLTNGAIDSSKFIQVVAVIDLQNLLDATANPGPIGDTLGEASLYVGGVNSIGATDSVSGTGQRVTTSGNAALNFTSWGNTDGSGLGSINSGLALAAGAGAGPYGNFDGEIAYVNFYNAGLTNAQITNNYNAVVPEPGTWAFLIIGSIGLIGFDQRRRRKAKAAKESDDEATTLEVDAQA